MTARPWPVLRDALHRYELRLWLLEGSRVDNETSAEVVDFVDELEAQAFLFDLMADEANLDVVREFLAGDFGRLCFISERNPSEERIAKVLAWSIMQRDLRVLRFNRLVREDGAEKVGRSGGRSP